MALPEIPNPSRRKFLRYGVGVGLGFTFVAAGNFSSGTKEFITVPRALPNDEFVARCIRCSACVQVCPTRALAQRDLSLNFKLIALPFLEASKGGCSAWNDGCSKCAEVCPSGAINKEQPLDKFKPALVVFDEKDCTNCMACFRACPVPGAVLFPNPQGGEAFDKEEAIPFQLKVESSPYKPFINGEKCVGCGRCVSKCIPRIMVLVPRAR